MLRKLALVAVLIVAGCQALQPVTTVEPQRAALAESQRVTQALQAAVDSGKLVASQLEAAQQAIAARQAREAAQAAAIQGAIASTQPSTPDATSPLPALISLIPGAGPYAALILATAGWVSEKARAARQRMELVATTEALGGPTDAAERELLLKIQSDDTIAAVEKVKPKAIARVAALTKEQAGKKIIPQT